ncbi:Uncharacterized protein TPAR_00780, partial [Tolypocladium paradoxum]
MSRPANQKSLDGWVSSTAAARGNPARTASPKTSGSSDGQRDYARQREALAAIATETRTVLPDILKQLPDMQAAKSEALFLDTLPPLKATECPKRTPTGRTTIRIVNDDSFNAAIELAASKASSPTAGRVAVLNMASHASPGGGWLKGARAQEEALCYRSSLALSLHRRYYPFKQRMGLYTPDVVVIRSDMPSGHALLVPDVAPADLPVVSVLSVAALRQPETRRTRGNTAAGAVVERL